MTRNNKKKKKKVKGKKGERVKNTYIFFLQICLMEFFSFGSQPKDKKVVKTKTTQRRYM